MMENIRSFCKILIHVLVRIMYGSQKLEPILAALGINHEHFVKGHISKNQAAFTPYIQTLSRISHTHGNPAKSKGQGTALQKPIDYIQLINTHSEVKLNTYYKSIL